MTKKMSAFKAAYRRSFQEYIAEASETALQHAYELGRQALRDGLGPMDIVSTQQEALLELLKDAETARDCICIVELSHEFSTECLAPFELTHRGFLEVEQFNRKLEDLNKELETFSYSVSHDLRAPLRAIDGYSRMILKKQEEHFDEETKRRFRAIRENVETMGRLIDELLTLSRLGKQEISNARLDMEGIIGNVWQNLLTSNPDRNMILRNEGVFPATGDPSLLREVFSNLLGNAVKFTRTRDIARIEVGSSREAEEVVYYVRDNGVGFDMKHYDKLFGVFQRLHSADDYEGTGVGLAIVPLEATTPWVSGAPLSPSICRMIRSASVVPPKRPSESMSRSQSWVLTASTAMFNPCRLSTDASRRRTVVPANGVRFCVNVM